MRLLSLPALAAPILGGLLSLGLVTGTVQAQNEQEWLTSSSLIDPDTEREPFDRYSYVNPDAPKGGTLNSSVTGTFDSFNPFVVRGTSAAGLTTFGGLLWETLMQQSLEEPSTSHPLIAEAFKYPEDYSSATYRLNPKARWHDGEPVTAEDVAWSLEILKEISPMHNRYFANVERAEIISDHEVKFIFDQAGNKELPHIMGDLPVLPKHWWEGTDKDGNQRDVKQPTLEPPLGSGPYKIASFDPGSRITWERVKDYWGEELAVNIGRNNFDRRVYTYFTDANAAWLAFQKGGLEDIQIENSSRRWVTGYDFPAVNEGDIVKQVFDDGGVQPMQAYVLNLREDRFQDRRIRKALTLVYNFEEMNRTQFFGQNTRTTSFFHGSELAATGLPEGRELEILQEFKDKLPPELFTEEYKLPVYDGPQAERQYLREAVQLFAEAGWVIRDGKMVNEKTGEPFTMEFLGRGPTDEIIAGGFIQSLRKIGVDASLRIVDISQYINRRNEFNFDVVTGIFGQTLSPGNEQREYWGSEAASISGSRNLGGIQDEVVDALIDKIIFASDREELVATTRALDRVLLWNYFMVPQYHRPVVWVAYWNKFGIPEEQPEYAGLDLDSWWIDPEKEAALAAKYRSQQ